MKATFKHLASALCAALLTVFVCLGIWIPNASVSASADATWTPSNMTQTTGSGADEGLTYYTAPKEGTSQLATSGVDEFTTASFTFRYYDYSDASSNGGYLDFYVYDANGGYVLVEFMLNVAGNYGSSNPFWKIYIDETNPPENYNGSGERFQRVGDGTEFEIETWHTITISSENNVLTVSLTDGTHTFTQTLDMPNKALTGAKAFMFHTKWDIQTPVLSGTPKLPDNVWQYPWSHSTNEAGEDVYTRDTASDITTAGSNLIGNSFSTDFMYSNSHDQFSSYVKFEWKSDSARYMFVYDEVIKEFYIQKGGSVVSKLSNYTFERDTWYHLQFVFEKENVIAYIGEGEDKTELIKYVDTGNDDFSGGAFIIGGWNATASVKNLEISTWVAPVPEPKSDWTASGTLAWDYVEAYYNSGENALGTLNYTASDVSNVTSVSFDFKYTATTTANDHFVGVYVDGYWHKLYLNANSDTELPYMAIYNGDDAYASREEDRIARENILANEWNSFKLALNEEGSVNFYLNNTLVYTFAQYSHFSPASIQIGTSGVEISIKNPAVEAPVIPAPENWKGSGSFTSTTEGVYDVAAVESTSVYDYRGSVNAIGSVSVDFKYSNVTAGAANNISFNVGGYWHRLYLNADQGTQALPYMQIYQQDGTTVQASMEDNRISRDVLAYDTWYTLKLAFDEGYVKFYIDNELIYTFSTVYFNTLPATMQISVCGVQASLKNLTVSGETWKGDSATKVAVNATTGYRTYTTPANGTGIVKYTGDVSNANTVSADFTYANSASSTDVGSASLAFRVWTGTGETDFWMFRMYLNLGEHYNGNNPVLKILQRGEGNGFFAGYKTYSEYRPARSSGVAAGETFNFKLIFDDDVAEVFINGELVTIARGVGNINWTGVEVYNYADEISVANFNVGNEKPVIPLWSVASGWAEKDGTYTAPATQGAVMWYAEPLSAFNTISADVQYVGVTSDDAHGSLAIQVDYEGAVSGTYILAVKPGYNGGSICLFSENATNGTPTFSKTFADLGINIGDWANLKLVVDDNGVYVYVNGNLVYNTCTAIGDITWKANRVGFNTWNYGAVIKNLVAETTEGVTVAGHKYGDWTETKKATCQAKGEEACTCSVCGDVQTRETNIDPNNHSYGDWTETKKATCTAKGEETRTCACGATETRETAIDADNHSFGDWTETKKATCTAKGEETRTCACGATETRETAIDATNHAGEGTWTETKKATCTAKGEEAYVCACGVTLETRETAIDATNHAGEGTWTETKKATCTAKGEEAYVCICGATTETRETEIDATNHAGEGTWTETKEATCSAKGEEAYVCICGETLETRETEIDADNHSFGDWTETKKATCTAKGEETHTCACGATETRETEIDADNHSFGDWVTTKEPTATEDGEKKQTCGCGAENTEVIPATGAEPEKPSDKVGCGSVVFGGTALALIALGACAVVFARKKD